MSSEDSPPNRQPTRRRNSLVSDTKNVFSSMFFGWQNPKDEEQQEASRTAAAPYEDSSSQTAVPPTRGLPLNVEEEGGIQTAIAGQLERLIPVEREKLRNTAIYRQAYKAIQWQRDNYLVGREYADWRGKERLRVSDALRSIESFQSEILYDETTLGHQHLARIASQFIPSETVRQALLPIVSNLPATVLYSPTQRAVVNLIDGQQSNLDSIVKNQLIRFLDNPANRIAIKNSTKGYITTTYRDTKNE